LGAPEKVMPPADDYIDRLIKYIPPDVIAAFLAIEGTIGGAAVPGGVLLSWIVFAVILGATPFYLRKIGGITKSRQIALSTIAFVVWTFAYSGPPFGYLHVPIVYGTVLMAIYTFLVPLIEV
jgi:hypothetical protein